MKPVKRNRFCRSFKRKEMIRMKKSILEKTALLLSLILMFCALPVGAIAGDGSAADPGPAPEEIHRIVLPGTTVFDLALLLSADGGFKVTGYRMNDEEQIGRAHV